MRHQVFGKKLSRTTKARRALLNNLANSLILSESITTTAAKAKFAKGNVEKFITLAKKNRLSDNRILASLLTQEAFVKLTGQIAPGFAKRAGGYTKIIRVSPRRGDSAPMAKLELVDWGKQAAAKSSPKSKQAVKSSAHERSKIRIAKKTIKKPSKKKNTNEKR